MRVVHVIKGKGIAGAERHLLDLLPGLQARGVDASVILLVEPDGSGDSLAAAFAERGVAVRRLTIARHVAPGLIGKLRYEFQQLKPHVVHTHLFHADIYGIPAAAWARVPAIITTRHNLDERREELPLRLTHAALWRMVSGGIAISEAVRAMCIAVEKAPADRLTVIYHGLPKRDPAHDTQPERRRARQVLRDVHGVPQDAPVLGILSRLIPIKGVDTAISAFAQVADEFPQAHLIIAGEGEQRELLEFQVKRANLAHRVHFAGWQVNPAHALAAFDIFLQTSRREGFGISLIEAMAQALPVIGTSAGAIPEVVVHGETGIIVPVDDVPALADAMRLLLADKPLRMHLGLVGQDRQETLFSVDRMIDDTLAFYHRWVAP